MDSEEVMWRDLYRKIEEKQKRTANNLTNSENSIVKTEYENAIQQIDGGFFERFGALFRDYGQPQAPTSDTKKPPNIDALLNGEDEATEQNENDENGQDLQQLQTTENDERSSDSGIDSINDPDSEPENELLKSNIISESVGWNIDELYSEILYEILHNVGCDQAYETGQTALFNYLQEAFKMSYDKHNTLLEAAEKKEAPEILLNVEIVEGKDIVPKDPNGLSDPFVTLFLQSLPTHRYNTSVKSATLNPTWEEHFSLPVSENAQDDTLCLEVWDFDPAETVREKMGKFMEVRGVKGLRKLVKEIAITASTGQHENEFIGRAAIPLSTIPASGMTMWYSLDKKNKAKRQGVLRIRLSFSSTKQPRVAAQEHQHLLKILLLHELETSKVVPYWWCGNYSAQAESLITQHAAQSGLNPNEQALCQWVVYTQVHADHPLSFTLFSNLLDKLIRPLQSNSFCEEEVKIFWESSKKLLPFVFNTIRKIRKKSTGDKNILKQVIEVLRIIAKMSLLEPPEKINLFPSELYRWLTYKSDDDSEGNWDFRGTLGDAIQQGAIDWFEHVLEHNPCQDHTDEAKMQHLIKIIQLVRSDLQKAVEYYDKIFQEIVSFQYARSLYILYEKRLTQLIEPEILDICKSLKRLRFDETFVANSDNVSEPMAQGTTLFELYLVIQKFVILGEGLCPTDCSSFQIKDFYLWFHGGVAQWLDIAVYKALQRIQKAVELDNLVPVSSEVKYSSSAVDTLTIFYQIKVFWQQLNWPDVEGSYTFVAKIIDDICRCCVYYADKMASKVDGMGNVENVYEKKFEVTNEWCLAINNIDYVRQSLQPFVNELSMEELLKKLSDLRSPLEAERCKQTLQNVIENAIDTVKNKILELLETVVKKMVPPMRRLLIEGAELLPTDSNSMDRIMRYLDDNLATLHEQLNEDNFQRVLDVLWDNVAEILSNILETNIEKRRPPSFYHSLNETLKLMLRTFKQTDSPNLASDYENLSKIAHLLALNGQETSDLIHSVHLERWEEQVKMQTNEVTTPPPLGQLTVRCKFHGCTLKIEVMNARNLIPMDTNGSCDSFVRIHLLPEDKFLNVMKPKTQTQNKTLFPLYDETFTINLTPEQRNCNNGLIMFSIKDKDFLGMSNQYICEAYYHFKDIPDTPESLESLPQQHLALTRPHKLDSEALKALENRQQGDKQAKEFVKKYRQRMGPPIPS
ncbi:protein unc-13 homolog 4B isoform X2 [Chrysoperla carnea]|uniref:protein unc-13 homolog 4B isoform X2 n=1 Tax=Chrysoperla carnea TaxID=189513 RepID=UPI001D0885DB|nr:protein unc-13 homolog 4B isoform X2 [Chrysoperla carnea]